MAQSHKYIKSVFQALLVLKDSYFKQACFDLGV